MLAFPILDLAVTVAIESDLTTGTFQRGVGLTTRKAASLLLVDINQLLVEVLIEVLVEGGHCVNCSMQRQTVLVVHFQLCLPATVYYQL